MSSAAGTPAGQQPINNNPNVVVASTLESSNPQIAYRAAEETTTNVTTTNASRLSWEPWEQSRTRLSSKIVHEEFLDEIVENEVVTYHEIPYEENRIISQTKRVREDRPIYYPEYEVEYVEKIVDVPVYVDKPVEKDVNMHDMTARSTEVIHGEYRHNSVPVVVAQTVKPIITEASESVDVDVYQYEPQIIYADVVVAKPVPSQVMAMGPVHETHQYVQIPAAQYNSILRAINQHVAATDLNALPYIKEGNSIPFLTDFEMPMAFAMPANGTQLLGQQHDNMEFSSTQWAALNTTTTNINTTQSPYFVATGGSVAGARNASYFNKSAKSGKSGKSGKSCSAAGGLGAQQRKRKACHC